MPYTKKKLSFSIEKLDFLIKGSKIIYFNANVINSTVDG